MQALEHDARVGAVGQQGRAEFQRGQHRGHAHFEEFVQVRAGDAQVAQPLEQRDRAVGRLRQHAEVELQLRQLAVEEEFSLERFGMGHLRVHAAMITG